MIRNLIITIIALPVFLASSSNLFSHDNTDSTKNRYSMVHITYSDELINNESAFGFGFSLIRFLDLDSDRPLSGFFIIDYNLLKPPYLDNMNVNAFVGLRLDQRNKSGPWTVMDLGSGISFTNKTLGVAAIWRLGIGYSNFSILFSTSAIITKDDQLGLLSWGLGYTF